MKSESLTLQNCLRNLDFEPEAQWPQALPCYSYNQELLCGFDRAHINTENVFPLEGKSLPQLMKALYPQLSFMELSRLSARLSLSKLDVDFEELWTLYQYRDTTLIQTLLPKVLDLPKEIQTWLHQKKVSPQDLAPLKALEPINRLQPYWAPFLQGHFSKSDGVKVLELLVELILLDFSEDLILTSKVMSGNQWFQHLQKLRFPISSEQDQKSEALMAQIQWPKKLEARWSRRGDRSGIELKLFFTHPDELKSTLMLLEKTNKELTENSIYETLWSKN